MERVPHHCARPYTIPSKVKLVRILRDPMCHASFRRVGQVSERVAGKLLGVDATNTRTMRALLMIGALALMSTSEVIAQEKKLDAMDRAWVTMNTEKLNVQLGLEEAQQAKVEDIAERYAKKHEALEATTPELSDKEMSDRTARLMKERDTEMKSVLNAEQYAKWDAMRQKGTSELTDEKKEDIKH